jgi:hypothetical protein
MNIFIKSFSYPPRAKKDEQTNFTHFPPQILAVLLSATCIGNDGRSCPLFHGSLAPMIFGKTDDDKMRLLLLKSNNITWTQTVFRCNDLVRFATLQTEIFETLSKTRYSSKSLKTLQVMVNIEDDKHDLLSFLQTDCEVLETLAIHSEGNFSLQELASFRALTNTLNRLAWSFQPIPDSQQFQHFNRLQELCLFGTQISRFRATSTIQRTSRTSSFGHVDER